MLIKKQITFIYFEDFLVSVRTIFKKQHIQPLAIQIENVFILQRTGVFCRIIIFKRKTFCLGRVLHCCIVLTAYNDYYP